MSTMHGSSVRLRVCPQRQLVSHSCESVPDTRTFLGTVPVSTRSSLVLGSVPLQFCLQANIYTYVSKAYYETITNKVSPGDREVLGPYYSHTLLNAMLSHSVRWCKGDAQIRQLIAPYENGDLFSRRARNLLFEELRLGYSKVATVQTLLLLSAQECSAGNRTQAWLYSGMAFRLIEDMGICIDGQKHASTVQLSDEDIEIRHRLFWSCYFWDKMISLYLERSPTLQNSTVSPPQIMCKSLQFRYFFS